LESKRMSSELIKHITDESFAKDVLEADVPVLVDYWAEWCGPCKMIAPVLDEIAKDYQGRLQIAKMNVDDNREVPGKFGIRGIPTLMIFKGGQKVAELTGWDVLATRDAQVLDMAFALGRLKDSGHTLL